MVKPFYKPLDRPEREETWYCYYTPNRKKQDSKTLPKVRISQVPDLTKEAVKEDIVLHKNINVGRVLETDSKFVKLAKTGGRKNLLCYRENEPNSTGPKAYYVPEWYHHGDGKGEEKKELSEEERHKKYKVTYGKRSYKLALEKPKTYERPDYMTHLEPEAREDAFGVSDRIPDRPIFAYDSFSYWKRDELEKSNKLPCLVPENNLQPSKGKAAHVESSVQSKPEVRVEKKVKLPKQSTKEIVPGYRKIDDRFGYITKWHNKWYAQAIRN